MSMIAPPRGTLAHHGTVCQLLLFPELFGGAFFLPLPLQTLSAQQEEEDHRPVCTVTPRAPEQLALWGH